MRPFLPFYGRIELVNVSFPNLFTSFGFEGGSDELPVVPVFLDHFQNGFILFWTPNFFVIASLNESSVPVETLVFVSVFHHFCNFVPLFGVPVMQLK